MSDKTLITQVYKDQLDQHLNTRQLLTFVKPVTEFASLQNNSALIKDDSLQIKLDTNKYFGLKFASNGASYQFNADTFIRLLSEKNYTEWLVPKTGGTFIGNVRINTNLYLGTGSQQTSGLATIRGVQAIYFKNSTHTVDGEWNISVQPSADIDNANSDLIFEARGAMFISGGEGANSLYLYRNNWATDPTTYPLVENEVLTKNTESMYLVADNAMYFEVNANDITKRICMVYNRAGNLIVPTNTTASKKVRNIAYQNGGTVSSLANGDICLVY